MVRATAFDPEIIKLLQTEFVPYAGDRHVVCGRPSPLREWFQPMAVSVNPRVPRGETAQGFYVAGADGTGYGWTQSGDPQTTLEFLRGGLKKFRAHPPRTVIIPDHTAEKNLAPAADTAVIRVYATEPAASAQTDARRPRVIGRDQLWVYADEVRQLVVASADEAQPVLLSPTLVVRIARFHLIDTSTRWGGRWSETEVKQAVVHAKVARQDRGRRTIRFAGTFVMRSDEGRDGFEGTLDGEIEVDVTAFTLVQFRAYGQGHGWGEHGWPRQFPATAGEYLNPRPRFPLVFALLLATDEVARTVPPVALQQGAPYAKPTLSANPR